MTEPVHQIRYGWSQSSLLGTRGMGPVQSTLPDDLLLGWDRYLRDHVWAAGKEPGFTFVVRDGVGALLRKAPATSPDGRAGSAAHVLLGRRLGARAALGLTSWDGWDEPVTEPLDWLALEPVAERGLKVLRARARMLPTDRLANLFTQLLSAPGEAYTVIGEPDPLALTCALGDLIGDTPTFASDEPDDTRADLPAAVFLREPPVFAATVTRRRLDPATAAHDPVLSPFAGAAVEAYVAGGPEALACLRRRPVPANAAEVREWVDAAQFAPGVLADLTRLNPAAWHRLEEPAARERVRAAAAGASSDDLLRALDGGLSDSLMAILVREAVARASADGALLERLTRFGPLPVELVAASLPASFGRLVRVTALLHPNDRRSVLERAAQDVQLTGLIQWIDEHATDDPDATVAVYSAMCGRLRSASPQEVWALVDRHLLVDALRAMSASEPQVSRNLVTLLGALPGRALTSPEVLDALLARPDPALLHALESAVQDRALQDRVRGAVRLAYYRSHGLSEPRVLLPEDGGALRRIFRRNPSNPGKPT